MTEEKKAKILEKFRKSTGLFNNKRAKKSFFEVYKDLSEEVLLDIDKNTKE